MIVTHSHGPFCLTCNLQEYIYSLRYGEDGVEFEMAATAHGKKKDKYNSKNKVGTP